MRPSNSCKYCAHNIRAARTTVPKCRHVAVGISMCEHIGCLICGYKTVPTRNILHKSP